MSVLANRLAHPMIAGLFRIDSEVCRLRIAPRQSMTTGCGSPEVAEFVCKPHRGALQKSERVQDRKFKGL
ncbi:hypothetical protein A6V36_18325 [Paraburkholderia ginsengiterrae]|uniref:Uncharacterized protein n=1 Tax=Paraburkholderia ginsengiterrae TaxID=1462993 RepID=A0A1A9MWZ7_9BURK|nr:hypothetical protein A6V37_10505 [Paraburkholderia ginsengiterrae]OAJ63443.1 hypothetical protein A6V36_18325 [Paraburkholderia ginsengiterrae]